MFRPILNRGGAGKSMSRPETVERFNPLVEQMIGLIMAYDDALGRLPDREAAAQINAFMNDARAQLGKLKETVLANGGVPPSGIDREPGQSDLGRTGDDALHALDKLERDFRDTLVRELDDRLHHTERARSICENLLEGSSARLDALHPLASRARRSGPLHDVPRDLETHEPVDLQVPERHAGPDEQPQIDTETGDSVLQSRLP